MIDFPKGRVVFLVTSNIHKFSEACQVLSEYKIATAMPPQLNPKAPILFVGSGRFHLLPILSSDTDVYIYDNAGLKNLDEQEKERFKNKRKAKLAKFLSSERIGLLVSTKPGQNKLKEAKELKKNLEKKYPEKRFYMLISDNINLDEIENFQMGMFINLACPGLELDSDRILNYDNLD